MTTWSLSSDFYLINNSSSAWFYGSKPAGFHVTGNFSLFTHIDPDPDNYGIVAWFGDDTAWYTTWLGVYYNTKPTAVILKDPWNFTVAFAANSVAMHPGSDGRFSVVRFTAPKDGNYSLDVTFTRVHSCASKSGAYIVYNNMTLWEISLFGIGDSKSFKSDDGGVSVRKNEHIDFIVGIGQDIIFNCDSTLARVDILLLNSTSTPVIPTGPSTNTSPTSENQTSEKNQTKVSVIIGSIGITLGLVICAILLYICYRNRNNKHNKQNISDNEVI
ncbi:hypothetical protein Glove_382g42 [Diversispora epigaea]|uniref:Uncharacterized protein n=1 Tax=Diversispora epigaea TaxID=1348612 RepID=A0A397H881_9GLOM|nr:hypothetical protein Glove_382g42 [Diversispora epigaea]